RDRPLYLADIDIEGFGIYIHEDRAAAGIVDRARRREEGEGCGDHLITRLQVQRLEGEQDRIGTRRDAYSMLHSQELGDGGLELLYGLAENERLLLDHRI